MAIRVLHNTMQEYSSTQSLQFQFHKLSIKEQHKRFEHNRKKNKCPYRNNESVPGISLSSNGKFDVVQGKIKSDFKMFDIKEVVMVNSVTLAVKARESFHEALTAAGHHCC